MTIAHISDLHLRSHLPGSSRLFARQSRRVPALLQAALETMSAQTRPDVVVLTGDVLDVPFYLMDDAENGRAAARQVDAMRQDYTLVRQLLDECPLPYVVVPGNHDFLPVFREVFGNQPSVGVIDGVTFVSFPWDEEGADHVPVRRFEEYPGYDRLDRPQVHVQHYVVTPELNEGYPHTYGNADSILEWNQRHGRPVLALSGHYHRGVEPVQEGGTTYATAAALCAFPFRWYHYELTRGSDSLVPRRYTHSLEHRFPGSPASAVDLEEVRRREPDPGVQYAVVTRRSMDARACDLVWTELVNDGYALTGVYSLPQDDEYERAFGFFAAGSR